MVDKEQELGNSTIMVDWLSQYTPIVFSGFCFLSFLISMPGVWLGLYENCIRNRASNLRTERIVLYLSCASSAMSFIGSFHWVALYDVTVCVVIGFLWFVACISLLVITVCIGIHLLIQIFQPKTLSIFRGDKMKKYKRLELVYLASIVFVVIAFSLWPLIGKAYGYNDWLCWINGHEKDGSINLPGYITVVAFYAATSVGLTFSAVVVVIVKIILCIRKRNAPNLYIWVFSVYLFTSWVVIFVTSVFTFFQADSLKSTKGLTVICSGLSPLMASLSTSIAVTYKKVIYRSPIVPRRLPRAVCYGSMSSGSGHSGGSKQIDWTSTVTEQWIPPPTGLINSDESDTYNDDYFGGIGDAVITRSAIRLN